MAQSPLKYVLSNWHKLVENFQTSTKDFYGSVEAGLKRREIPGLTTRRIDYDEGGVLSARREYLRISGGRFSFDVCAAPFGTGFFFSWWLVRRPARLVLLHLLVFLALMAAYFYLLSLVAAAWERSVFETGPPFRGPVGHYGAISIVVPVLLVLLAFVLDCLGVAALARGGFDDPEEAILSVPILGWVYERVFAPVTYWKLDTAIMFQSAAAAAVQEALDGLLTAKGLRALTEEERKPVFSKLL